MWMGVYLLSYFFLSAISGFAEIVLKAYKSVFKILFKKAYKSAFRN